MASFRKSFGSGIFYTAIAKYSNVILSLAIGAVLARLLSPQEFGIVAILTVFTIFFELLSDFGIGPAVVQTQNLDQHDLKSIFSFSIILGLVLSAIFFLLSPFIATFYQEDELINIGRLISLSIFFHSMIIVPKALIRKSLKFKQIGIYSVFIHLFVGIIAIFLAYNEFSYFSLVFMSIFNSFFTFLAFYWMSPVGITFRIRYSALRKISKFSTYQMLFNFVNYFSRNLDNILIGKYLGTSSLGYYDRSYKIMKMPVQNLTHIFSPVMPAMYASIKNDPLRIFNSYMQIVKLLATVGFPLSIFLYFAAPEIISLVYGNQWTESIPVFQILAFSIGTQMVMSSSGAIFQSTFRTDLLFVSGLLNSALIVSGILYGVFYGGSIESVGMGVLLAYSINFFVVFFILIKYALKESFMSFLKTFIIPLFISLLVGLTLWLVSSFDLGKPPISLLVKSALALFTFGCTFGIFKSNRELVFKILKRNK
jgi:teichuronic acid exporter